MCERFWTLPVPRRDLFVIEDDAPAAQSLKQSKCPVPFLLTRPLDRVESSLMRCEVAECPDWRKRFRGPSSRPTPILDVVPDTLSYAIARHVHPDVDTHIGELGRQQQLPARVEVLDIVAIVKIGALIARYAYTPITMSDER